MGKNQSASNLTNIIKQDANGNITFVSGSTTLMSVSSSGAIATTGNVAGTASYASNAELFDGLDSTVFAITGSNTFTGIQTVNSNLIVTGSITAQTLVVQTVTSSVIYSSGSNVFGNSQANTQSFTGSLLLTGSAIFSSTIKSNDTNGFAIGSIAGYRRIQYGTSDATSFAFLTNADGYAGMYAGTAVFSSNINALRANIGGPANDADISLNVSAPSGAGKYIMFGRNSSNTAVFAIDSSGNVTTPSIGINNGMTLSAQALGVNVGTSWVSTGVDTIYVGFVFVYYFAASGERNTAVLTCNYYPAGVTVISQSNNGGNGVQFQMNGSILQMKTTSGTVYGTQLVYFKV